MTSTSWRFFGGTDLEIGDHCYLQYRCFLDNTGPVRIGAKCSIGVHAMLLTGTHDIGLSEQRRGADRNAAGDRRGLLAGQPRTVAPGATIGRGCVVAAGAVVTGDCEPAGLYAGTPARRVRDLT